MTATIDVQLLQPQATEIIRRNHEGRELIEIMYQGKPIARVTWVSHPEQVSVEQMQQVVANLDQLSAEISQQWPEDVSALDAIHDVRREL
jgi:antitoxin (DNA-binding transcriptional repressor) of toxin-antitoxin stability system